MPAHATVPITDTCLVCEGSGQIVFPVALGIIDFVPCLSCEGKGIRIAPVVYALPPRKPIAKAG